MYNFKCLFLLAYPHCIHFNIRDFKPCYVFVPKQKFRLYTTFQTHFYSILMSSLFIVFYKILYFLYRYDSGIFILRFMQSYDGTTVQKISNVWFLTRANSYVHYKVQIVHCKSNSSILISIVNTYVHYRLIYYRFGRSFSFNFYLINTTSSLIYTLNC